MIQFSMIQSIVHSLNNTHRYGTPETTSPVYTYRYPRRYGNPRHPRQCTPTDILAGMGTRETSSPVYTVRRPRGLYQRNPRGVYPRHPRGVYPRHQEKKSMIYTTPNQLSIHHEASCKWLHQEKWNEYEDDDEEDEHRKFYAGTPHKFFMGGPP